MRAAPIKYRPAKPKPIVRRLVLLSRKPLCRRDLPLLPLPPPPPPPLLRHSNGLHCGPRTHCALVSVCAAMNHRLLLHPICLHVVCTHFRPAKREPRSPARKQSARALKQPPAGLHRGPDKEQEAETQRSYAGATLTVINVHPSETDFCV